MIDLSEFKSKVPSSISAQIGADIINGIYSGASYGDGLDKRFFIAGLDLDDLEAIGITDVNDLSQLHSMNNAGSINIIRFNLDKDKFGFELTPQVINVLRNTNSLKPFLKNAWKIFEIESPYSEVPFEGQLKIVTMDDSSTPLRVDFEDLPDWFKDVSEHGIDKYTVTQKMLDVPEPMRKLRKTNNTVLKQKENENMASNNVDDFFGEGVMDTKRKKELSDAEKILAIANGGDGNAPMPELPVQDTPVEEVNPLDNMESTPVEEEVNPLDNMQVEEPVAPVEQPQQPVAPVVQQTPAFDDEPRLDVLSSESLIGNLEADLSGDHIGTTYLEEIKPSLENAIESIGVSDEQLNSLSPKNHNSLVEEINELRQKELDTVADQIYQKSNAMDKLVNIHDNPETVDNSIKQVYAQSVVGAINKQRAIAQKKVDNFADKKAKEFDVSFEEWFEKLNENPKAYYTEHFENELVTEPINEYNAKMEDKLAAVEEKINDGFNNWTNQIVSSNVASDIPAIQEKLDSHTMINTQKVELKFERLALDEKYNQQPVAPVQPVVPQAPVAPVQPVAQPVAPVQEEVAPVQEEEVVAPKEEKKTNSTKDSIMKSFLNKKKETPKVEEEDESFEDEDIFEDEKDVVDQNSADDIFASITKEEKPKKLNKKGLLGLKSRNTSK